MAINSPVDICNLALSLLNVAPITSIDDPTTANEEICSLWYDQVRRESLRRHTWNFAVKRVILAPDSTAPVFGYQNAFNLPSDYIRIMHINAYDGYNDAPIQGSHYTIENNKVKMGQYTSDSGQQLRLVYVADFETVSQMDPSFISYFSTMLGQKLAYAITQSNSAVQRMDALMKDAESVARAIDGQENPPKRIERSASRSARRNRGSVRNYDGTMVWD